MNRMLATALVAVVIVAALVIAVVAAGKGGPPDAVRSMADDYARYLSFTAPEQVTVQRTVRAARPDQFQQEMSKATFSNSIFYNTDYNLQKMAESGRPAAGISQGRAVSYPPTELWCVLFSNGGVVVIGEHHDLFNAEWVLHEVVDTQKDVAQVGCKLGTR